MARKQVTNIAGDWRLSKQEFTPISLKENLILGSASNGWPTAEMRVSFHRDAGFIAARQ
jgi:hypothetical protein